MHAISAEYHHPVDITWYAIVMAKFLQCTHKAKSSFWIQHGNRDPENTDVFGYVTAEVGFLVDTDPDATFKERLQHCFKLMTDLSEEHRNVFPEISNAHPAFESFLKCSVGINMVGSAMDVTDRTVIHKALGGGGDNAMVWGPMNWIEIGNESNHEIVFYGRTDIVDFGYNVLLPALCDMDLGKL